MIAEPCTTVHHLHLIATCWLSLERVGIQLVPPDEAGLDAHCLELRQCPRCGDYLAHRMAGAVDEHCHKRGGE